ncbi:MAG: hypothetical protein ACREDO_06100 [Methyloceanibacter sp.]
MTAAAKPFVLARFGYGPAPNSLRPGDAAIDHFGELEARLEEMVQALAQPARA